MSWEGTKHVILTSDPAAANLQVLHDPSYLEWLASRDLPPPSAKPAGVPYIAKLTGTSAKYGLDRFFLSYRTDDGIEYHFHPAYPDVYEIQKHKDGRAVRGFVALMADGSAVRISVPEMVEAMALLDSKRVSR